MFYNRYIINNDLKYNNSIYQILIYKVIKRNHNNVNNH